MEIERSTKVILEIIIQLTAEALLITNLFFSNIDIRD
jgi:hypothetical protein